jgi:hypothetical protein
VLPVRHLLGGVPDLARQQTVSEKRDDRHLLGAEGQGAQERRPLAVPQLRRLLDALPAAGQAGDVLAAIRAQAIIEYSRPRWLAEAVNDPKKLPILIAIPVFLFLVVGTLTGLLNFRPDLSGGIATTSSSRPGWWTCTWCRRRSSPWPCSLWG